MKNIKIPTTNIKTSAKAIGRSIYHWEWTDGLFFWIVRSAGKLSGLAFLLASIWMSVHATEQSLLNKYMGDFLVSQIQYWATNTYIVLPVCILPLSLIQAFEYLKTWRYHKTIWHTSGLWFAAYTLPALVFLIIDISIISNSGGTNTNYILPDYLVSARSITAYSYGLIAFLHHFIGKPQHADRLAKKDLIIADKDGLIGNLRKENESNLSELRKEKDALIETLQRNNEVNLSQWQKEKDVLTESLEKQNAFNLSALRKEKDALIEDLKKQNEILQLELKNQKAEMENQKTLLAESKKRQEEMIEEANKNDEAALQAYSEECIKWLKSGIKTANAEEISKFTGHGKRKIENLISKGIFQLSPRNKELILVSSLVEWLKDNPPLDANKEQGKSPMLRVVNS